jgi:peptidoglycan/LPS O-acetylase OafA/YrhL
MRVPISRAMKTESSTHIPELDGVRGIAILMVVVYHAFLFVPNPPTGWSATLASFGLTGVDLFFTLSGFLITGILLKAKGRSGYFRDFYAKRALRIWPLYYLLLFASYGLVPRLLSLHSHRPPSDVLEGRSLAVYVLLLQNLWYRDAFGPILLASTWSLAVEEHFYVVWPWLVSAFSRKNLVFILAAVLALSPLARLWAGLRGLNGHAIYYMTCFRLDGLSLGALLALYCESAFFSLNRTKRMAIGALAIGTPPSLWLLLGHSQAFGPLQNSMVALASAGTVALAVWCCRADSLLGVPLRARWLRYVGKVSYCLYLIHQPFYCYALNGGLARRFFGVGHGGAVCAMIFGFLASLGIAGLSWSLFESRILKLKGRLEPRPAGSSAAVCST